MPILANETGVFELMCVNRHAHSDGKTTMVRRVGPPWDLVGWPRCYYCSVCGHVELYFSEEERRQ